MIPITVFEPNQGPWHLRLRQAIAHPGKWLSDLSGERSGLRPADPVRPDHGRRDRPHRVRPAAAEHPRRLRPRPTPASSSLVALAVARRAVAAGADRPAGRPAQPRPADADRRGAWSACFSVGTGLASRCGCWSIVRSGSGIGQATVGPTHNSLLADYFPIGNRPAGVLVPPRRQRGRRVRRAARRRRPRRAVRLAGAVLRLRHPRRHPRRPRPAPARAGPRASRSARRWASTDALCTEEPPPSFAEALAHGVEDREPAAHLLRAAVPGRVAHRLRRRWPPSSTSRSSGSTSVARGWSRPRPSRPSSSASSSAPASAPS